MIHPGAGPAFLDPAQAYTLEVEILPDQRVQVRSARDDIAPRGGGRHIAQIKPGTKRVVSFARKECDLTFIIVPEIKETIAPNPMARDTLNAIDFDDGMIAGRFAVPPEKIVAGRDVKVRDLHGEV